MEQRLAAEQRVHKIPQTLDLTMEHWSTGPTPDSLIIQQELKRNRFKGRPKLV